MRGNPLAQVGFVQKVLNDNLMIRISLLLLFLLAAVGCSDSAGKAMPVSGTVTLDGTPISEGSITFRPVDARQRPESADIDNGQFSLNLPPGKSRVEVHASRRSSAPPVAGMGPTMEDYIPEQYKGPASVLDADVKPDGPNRLDYPLVTEKGKK